MRRFLRILFNRLFRIFTRITVTGLEHIPMQGGCLITANHIGILDGPLIFSIIQRDDATGFVAEKYQRNALIRWLVDAVGGIWLDRFRADFRAMKEAHRFLENGGLLGIAPEGTRSRTHQMNRPKSGVAFLAAKVDAPVIPMAITGTEDAVGKILRLGRPRISVTIGEPFFLPPLDRKDRDAALKRNTDEIMCRIAAMLPPEYRGVYADHPRLEEIVHGMDG